MNRKVAIRFAIGLFAIAILFGGFQQFTKYVNDPNRGDAETAGVIAALQETNIGTKLVAFSPSGVKRDIPGSDPGIIDRDFNWSPTGGSIYFASNRVKGSAEKGAFNIYQWKYGEPTFDAFTNQHRSQSAPRFGPIGIPGHGLVLVGGTVIDFDPAKKTGGQIMPPPDRQVGKTEEGGGATGSMESYYNHFGSSFRQALWASVPNTMWAVMRRDDGEVLIYHQFGFDEKGAALRPIGIVAGSRIQMDESSDGKLIICQQDAAPTDLENPPAEWIEGSKVVPKLANQHLTHMLWFAQIVGNKPSLTPMLPPEPPTKDQVQPIFRDPAISPDGKSFVVILTQKTGESEIKPIGILLCPLEVNGLEKGKMIVQGDVSQPSWSPDSNELVFIASDGKTRAIYAIKTDGTGRRKIADDANYSFPRFSPQEPKKAG